MISLDCSLKILDSNIERLCGISEKLNAVRRKITAICVTFENVGRFSHELEKLRKDEKALCEKQLNQRIKNAIIKNNAEVALFHHCVPYVETTINRFAGKKLGKKTLESFRDYFKKISGCTISIERSFDKPRFTVSLLNASGLSDFRLNSVQFTLNDGELFDEKGYLLPIKESSYCLYHIKDRYVDDADSEVEVLKQLSQKIVEATEIFNNACSEYNDHAVGYIREVSQIYAPRFW